MTIPSEQSSALADVSRLGRLAKMSLTTSLISSPDEIIEKILVCLYAPDLLACSATCRRINQLINESSKLQLVVEAYAAGYRLCPGWEDRRDQSLSFQDILTKVVLNQSPSHRMKVKSSFLPPMRDGNEDRNENWDVDGDEDGDVCRYSVQIDGIWAECSRLPRDQKDDNSKRRGYLLSFYRLSDLESNLQSGSTSHVSPWISLKIHRYPHDFFWDLSQDLLLLEESTSDDPMDFGREVSLKRLSTGEPHPLAIHQQLPHPNFHKIQGIMHLKARAARSLICLVGEWELNPYVGIWNWVTGVPFLKRRKATSYEFLTDSLVILVTEYDNDNDNDNGGDNNTNTATDDSTESGWSLEVWCMLTNKQKATLQMPFGQFGYEIKFRNHGPYPLCENANNPPFGVFQHDDTATTIVILHIHSFNSGNDDGTLVIISVPELLNILSSAGIDSDCASKSTSPTFIPWNTWMPQATRWLRFSRGTDVYTHKSILYVPRHSVNKLFGLEGVPKYRQGQDTRSLLFDFNPRSMRRDAIGNSNSKHSNAVTVKCDRSLSNPSQTQSQNPNQNPADAMVICIEKPTRLRMQAEGVITSCLPFRLFVGPAYKSDPGSGHLIVNDLFGIRHLEHASTSTSTSAVTVASAH